MSSLFKKRSVLAKKRKQIEKELSSLNSDIRSLSKSVDGKPVKARKERRPPPGSVPTQTNIGMDDDGLLGESLSPSGYDDVPGTPRKSKNRQAQLHDERFVGYLANSFDSMRPLRHERRIQRNKAVVMAVFVLLLLFWLLYRHFLM
ncbi:hypothetical protein ACFLQU_02525 [Verrucomicrobiota bacterium]